MKLLDGKQYRSCLGLEILRLEELDLHEETNTSWTREGHNGIQPISISLQSIVPII